MRKNTQINVVNIVWPLALCSMQNLGFLKQLFSNVFFSIMYQQYWFITGLKI